MQGRIRTLTTFKTGDPVMDRYQEHVKQTLQPVIDNPVLNAVDFRWAEVSGTDPSKTPTFVLQYRSTGTTWTTIATFDSSGQIAQPAWTAPTLLNSWANFGGGNEVAGYMKDANGFVHLRGLIRNGTIGLGAFVLPSGFRPTGDASFAVPSNSAFGYVFVRGITTPGEVVPQIGSNVWVSLDGITFDTRS